MGVHASMGSEHPKVSYEYDNQTRSGSLVSFSRKNYAGKDILNIDYPSIGAPWIATETRDNQTYFYAELKPLPGKPLARVTPKKIGVVWDASGSGAARDHGRELDLLDAYFKALKNVEVTLVLARDRAEAAQSFSIINGDWRTLRKALESVVYDGATNVAALSASQDTHLNLLFSDGLSNFGSGDFVVGDKPLFAVNASASTDLPRLRAWAEQSGGRLLDLLSLTSVQAVEELTHQSAYLAGISSTSAKELVSASGYAESGVIEVAGILTRPEATIELDWVTENGKHHRQTVEMKNVASTTLAARRWAALKVAQLETDYTNNRAAIQRLGKQFLMVTRETSLIVLDRLEDYVRYEIVPPEGLRGEYERMLVQKNLKEKAEHKHHLDEVVRSFEFKKAWWEKDFPKGEKPNPKDTNDESGGSRLPPQEYAMARINRESAERRMPVAAMPLMMAAPAPLPTAVASTVDSSSAQAEVASIHLKKWEPDSPYAKRLRQALPDQMYAIYLDERPSYTSSTAFFLDAADIFIERGQQDLGLRILSNLAEMNLENRHILRILAYRLLQAKQPKLALPILQRVLALSPNEPQSWRDLGLAYAEDAQYQKAVDSLWEVVARSWDRRFPDIELIALNELNALIATAPKSHSIDTSRMDERLLKNLPLDIRAVLGWDSDNADIDLWVTDPNGEKVFYMNRLGYQGGSISSDFTGGYGPEEFSLRNAKPGKYKVEAHFFGNRQQIVSGATTLMLRFSTAFGTPRQKDENIILRLTGQGADVEVGTFEVQPRK
jgi:tetratricopeptide (TPR) repeat protein